MRYITIICCLLLMLLAVLPVQAASTITQDPNAGKAVETKEETPVDIWSGDARLDKKITYQTGKKSLWAIMDDLSGLSEIKLNCGINDSEWQLRDCKMVISIKELPLKELMQSIARVMTCTWSRRMVDGVYTYRLVTDKERYEQAVAQNKADQDSFDRKMSEKRSGFFGGLLAFNGLSDEDKELIKKANPYLYEFSTDEMGKVFTEFLRNSDATLSALKEGKFVRLRAADMPWQAQSALIQTMQHMSKAEVENYNKQQDYMAQQGYPEIGVKLVADLPPDLENKVSSIIVDVNYNISEKDTDPLMGRKIGNVTMRVGDKQVRYSFDDPQGSFARLKSETKIQAREQNCPVEELAKSRLVEIRAAQIADTQRYRPVAKSWDHPDDPVLHKKVKIKNNGGLKSFGSFDDMDEVVPALAEASGYSVVSDYYTIEEQSRLFEQEAKLRVILDSIDTSYECNWLKNGELIEFQCKSWLAERAIMIPDAWLEKWRKKLKETGYLDIDDMAQIAVLRWDQFVANLAYDPDLYRHPTDKRDVLRFYASLDDARRQMLFTPKGITLGDLTEEQAARAVDCVVQRDAALLEAVVKDTRFIGVSSQDRERTIYTIKAVLPGVQQELSWEIKAQEGK